MRDWDALMWTLPAVQLADTGLARELLLRMCELHGYAPGRGVHYFDGTLFEPGFALEGVAAYPIAVDRYIRDTGDDAIVDEPAIGDALYLASDDLKDRRDSRVPLYSTDVTPSGGVAMHPFTLHGNATVAQALEVLRRTLDEQSAREVEDPAAVRAAIKRHFAADRDPKGKLASSIDLAGHRSEEDVASASALWLPLYEAIDRQDSLYRRTVKAIPDGQLIARAADRPAARPRRREGARVAAPRAAARRPRRGDRGRDGAGGGEWRRCGALRASGGNGVARGARAGDERLITFAGRSLKCHLDRPWVFGAVRGSSSVGRAQPCQGWGRGFESRLPLFELRTTGSESSPFVFAWIGQHAGWRNWQTRET